MGIAAITLSLITLTTSPVLPAFFSASTPVAVQEVRSHQILDLTQRHGNKTINEGYNDNIRLYLHYLKGDRDSFFIPTSGGREVDWEKVRQPFSFNIMLSPGQALTFHPAILSEFKNVSIRTAATSLSGTDGYRFIDGLFGNGVCHIASFLNMAASRAGLRVTAKVNHDFAPIYGVPHQYGTAIYFNSDADLSSQEQNLYIQNRKLNTVTIMFSIGEKDVEILITETVGFTVGD